MTPARLLECLDILGWSQRSLAERLGYPSHTSVKQWAQGRGRVPDDVARWLETLARFHTRHPAPSREG